MEKINVTPVTSAYASWQTEEPLVELPTDEINIEKAEEVGRVINSVEDHLLLEAVENLKDSGKKMAYAMGVADGQRELVQQSMSTLKELTNSPEVQKALESEGLTVDYEAIRNAASVNVKEELGKFLDKAEWKEKNAIIRPLTEEEKAAVEGGTCAYDDCAYDDCVESTDTDVDSDVDTDTMLIVHDLSERLAALEARIALFNGKASHKI